MCALVAARGSNEETPATFGRISARAWHAAPACISYGESCKKEREKNGVVLGCMPRTTWQSASSLQLYGRSCLRLWGESQASVLGARWTSRMRGTLELRDVLYAMDRIKRRGITRTRGEVKGWEGRSQVSCTASALRAPCARHALPRIPSLQQ